MIKNLYYTSIGKAFMAGYTWELSSTLYSYCLLSTPAASGYDLYLRSIKIHSNLGGIIKIGRYAGKITSVLNNYRIEKYQEQYPVAQFLGDQTATDRLLSEHIPWLISQNQTYELIDQDPVKISPAASSRGFLIRSHLGTGSFSIKIEWVEVQI